MTSGIALVGGAGGGPRSFGVLDEADAVMAVSVVDYHVVVPVLLGGRRRVVAAVETTAVTTTAAAGDAVFLGHGASRRK